MLNKISPAKVIDTLKETVQTPSTGLKNRIPNDEVVLSTKIATQEASGIKKFINTVLRRNPDKPPINMYEFAKGFAKKDKKYFKASEQAYLRDYLKNTLGGDISQKKAEVIKHIREIAEGKNYYLYDEAVINSIIKKVENCKTIDDVVKLADDKFFKKIQSECRANLASTDVHYSLSRFAILKFFTPKTTNPEVLKIKEEVKKLGITNFEPGNDLKKAQAILDALKKAIASHKRIPSEIIVPEFQMPLRMGEMFFSNDTSLMIIAGTKYENFVNKYFAQRLDRIRNSTSYKLLPEKWKASLEEALTGGKRPIKSDEFNVLHEIGHLNTSNYSYEAFGAYKPTKEMLEKATKFTGITPSEGFAEEVFAELQAKKMYVGAENLTKEEKELEKALYSIDVPEYTLGKYLKDLATLKIFKK